MSYGDYPKYIITTKPLSQSERRVPGLRDDAPPSPCKVYRIINGKKILLRVE